MRKIITTIILLIFSIDSTGVSHFSPAVFAGGHSLRPVASTISPAEVDSVVEALRLLGEGRTVEGAAIAPSDDLKELIRELSDLTKLKSQQSLSLKNLHRIKQSLDRLSSASLSETLPAEIRDKAGQAKRGIEQLMIDVSVDEVSSSLPEASKTSRWKQLRSPKKQREIGITLLVMAAVITIAYFGYGRYLFLREKSTLIVTALTAFFVSMLADFLRQRGQMISGSQKSMDFKHILKWGLLSLLLDGLITGFLWHDACFMDSAAERWLKLAVDQAIFAPFFFIPFPMTLIKWLIERKPFDKAIRDSMTIWSLIYGMCLFVWPAALVSAYFIFTAEAPVLTVIITKLGWTTTISYLLHKDDEENTERLKRNFNIYKIGTVAWIVSLGCLLWYFYSPHLLALSVMAAAWSFLFLFKLKRILSQEPMVENTQETEPPQEIESDMPGYLERLEGIMGEVLALQRDLTGYLLDELQLPQARAVAVGQSVLRDKALQHLESSG